MTWRIPVLFWVLFAPLAACLGQSPVQVEPADLQGSRPLEQLTQSAVVRDYLQSWQELQAALDWNQPQLLNQDFVGIAQDKLANTIAGQVGLGIHTRFLNPTHRLQIVFYSPDGLSIQMIDHAEFDDQVLAGDKVLATQRVRTRYLVILTPAAARWKVRIFQSAPEQ